MKLNLIEYNNPNFKINFLEFKKKSFQSKIRIHILNSFHVIKPDLQFKKKDFIGNNLFSKNIKKKLSARL